jgi:hypothetical protein
MNLRHALCRPALAALLGLGLIPALALTPPASLDNLYGVLVRPAYLKYYEADLQGRVPISPYLQVASHAFPACLDRALAPYDWVINADGNVAVVPETPHPYGHAFPKGYTRPEDHSWHQPGTVDSYGHAGAMGGQAGRIGGELIYEAATGSWAISNKSAHYSRKNPDRTPDQLVNAARLIRQVMDPDGAGWGEVRYLLGYGTPGLKARLEQDPHLEYQNPAKKTGAFVVLETGASL